MKRLSLAIFIVASLVVAMANAQTTTTHPTSAASNKGTANSADLNNDATVVKQAAADEAVEIEISKLAVQKATRQDVKNLAQKMVDDHLNSNAKLKTFAADLQIALPTKMDSGHSEKIAMLEKKSGVEFDAEYVTEQVRDHEKTVGLLQHEIANGKNTKVRQYAKETLVVVRRHLVMARDLLPPDSSESQQTSSTDSN